MQRNYLAFRFAYETKYWIDCLVQKHTEIMKAEIENGLLKPIEDLAYSNMLNGRALTYTLNVTTGSIIEMAIDATKNLTLEEWKELAKETEVQKNLIKDYEAKDATPSAYLSQETCDRIEELQSILREDNPRVPKKTYIIKLAVFYMYKKTFC